MVENTKETKEPKALSLVDYKKLAPEGIDATVYLKLVKDQIMSQKLSTEDFNLFLYICKRTGLDPLTKQIHAVPHWSTTLGKYVMTVISGIDGFRLVGQRTGTYAGQDDVVYDPADESLTNPKKATVTVYKMIGGTRVPFTATARWNEYVKLSKEGKVDGQWSKMPYLMLGKCAEALALRKAFPNELSGVYTPEEMEQAGNGTEKISDLPTPERFKKDDIKVVTGAPLDTSVEAVKTEPAPKMPDFDAMKKQNSQKGKEAAK